MTLRDIAPRLARARDEYEELLAFEREARSRLTSELLHKDWLVAHRELQLLRAGARNSRSYVQARGRKLEQAHRERAAVLDHIAHLADWRRAA